MQYTWKNECREDRIQEWFHCFSVVSWFPEVSWNREQLWSVKISPAQEYDIYLEDFTSNQGWVSSLYKRFFFLHRRSHFPLSPNGMPYLRTILLFACTVRSSNFELGAKSIVPEGVDRHTSCFADTSGRRRLSPFSVIALQHRPAKEEPPTSLEQRHGSFHNTTCKNADWAIEERTHHE